LVKGRSITEYPHQDKVYIEGRPGSEYEIEVRNHTIGRIEAVVSVDGLGVTDGKPAGSASRGYLIRPGDTLRVPGWTLDTANVAKFAFAAKPESYATQMTGSDRNNGVIGVMAFREHQYYWPSHGLTGINSTPTYVGIATTGITSPTFSNDMCYRGVAPPGASSYAMNANMDSMTASASVTPNLGTAFGDATGFSVYGVSFNRGLLLGTLVLYYDNRVGLRARGVRIERRRAVSQEPQAFPADFCAPPPGWSG
jgi:hypothetical protein